MNALKHVDYHTLTFVRGFTVSIRMEQHYPVESNTVPVGHPNQFARQNLWFHFNLFF